MAADDDADADVALDVKLDEAQPQHDGQDRGDDGIDAVHVSAPRVMRMPWGVERRGCKAGNPRECRVRACMVPAVAVLLLMLDEPTPGIGAGEYDAGALLIVALRAPVDVHPRRIAAVTLDAVGVDDLEGRRQRRMRGQRFPFLVGRQ
jgi:hypothetical protein